MNVTREEIKQFLKDSIEWLVDQDLGCSTLKLDDRLAICVGWLDGYDENDEDVIHSKEEPKYALNAGIKVYTSDDMRTDYEFINSPYYDNGEVVQTDVSVQPDADLDELADYFIKEYGSLENLDIEEDGRIVEEPKEEDEFDDAYEPMEDEDEVEQEVEVKEESLEENKKELDLEDAIKCADDDVLDKHFGKDTPERKLAGVIKHKDDKKDVKESLEGESIIDDLIERAQSMYDEGGYGDIDDCVAQAIDDGLIYSDDILELAKHYGTLPDDSDLIAEFYDELSSDVHNGIEEHEEEDDDSNFVMVNGRKIYLDDDEDEEESSDEE